MLLSSVLLCLDTDQISLYVLGWFTKGTKLLAWRGTSALGPWTGNALGGPWMGVQEGFVELLDNVQLA